jgi:hypothetical protein
VWDHRVQPAVPKLWDLYTDAELADLGASEEFRRRKAYQAERAGKALLAVFAVRCRSDAGGSVTGAEIVAEGQAKGWD